jgi:hypothetical protein
VNCDAFDGQDLDGKHNLFDEVGVGRDRRGCLGHRFLEGEPGDEAGKEVRRIVQRHLARAADLHFEHAGEDEDVDQHQDQRMAHRPERADHLARVALADLTPGHFPGELAVPRQQAHDLPERPGMATDTEYIHQHASLVQTG